jgi:5-methylcytosine-specific restriction endonuclease McrA
MRFLVAERRNHRKHLREDSDMSTLKQSIHGFVTKGDTALAVTKYGEYLKSKHWKNIKNKAFKFYKGECWICRKKHDLNIHHRIYKDKRGSILGREKMSHLLLLCFTCHKIWHKTHGFKEMDMHYYSMSGDLVDQGFSRTQAIKECVNYMSIKERILTFFGFND